MGDGFPGFFAYKRDNIILFKALTTQNSLRCAWNEIRSNGLTSPRSDTVKAIKEFDSRSEYYLKQIQRSLRDGSFEFQPQIGVLKKKKTGFRGIVVAPIRNRIVERAILDCLQSHVPFVKTVISTPTSVGGVPNRGVGHGLALVQNALALPDTFYIRSDISGFFDNIPKNKVLEILAAHVDDQKFLSLIDRATTVALENEQALGENRKIFPESDIGVAQGSPLSGLFGNILLYEFDQAFNARGITCVRFVDDFILIGEREKTKKAFLSAKKYLSGLGLSCHDPYANGVSPDKAQFGYKIHEFTFLGYKISSGLISPGDKAVSDLISKINLHIAESKQTIFDTIKSGSTINMGRRFSQTLYLLDKIILGWSHAFSYSNVALHEIDDLINESIFGFQKWFKQRTSVLDIYAQRRLLGVSLVADVPKRKFDELPFVFQKIQTRRARTAIKVSTDGSRIPYPKSGRSPVGAGGWAAVFHDPYSEISGGNALATNNQMELQAVIEALNSTTPDSRVHVFTDSNYIVNIVTTGGVVRENVSLWREIENLCRSRKVSFEWIKAHAGDTHNERADVLANGEAKSLI